MLTDEQMDRSVLNALISVTVFVFLHQVKANCPDGCIGCNPAGQQCSDCSQGYWLNSGKCEKCPENCLECQLGRCTVCKVMFYNLAVNCGYRCDLCNESGCDDTGICYSCRQEFYGEYCQNDCGHCLNRQCSRQQCVLGCDLGYVQQTIDNTNLCFPCPANCNICLNTTFCTHCKNGYYKNRFIGSNGHGYANCIACDSTSVCTKCQNISNCLQCGVTNGVLICDLCNGGVVSVGSRCEPLKCSEGCFDKCDENGNCIAGCKDGYTGSNCTYRCFEHCTKCRQLEQNVCEKCIDGYYTQSCNAKCNQNCKVVPEMPVCSINDGNCINGCSRGFWGLQCQFPCSSNCFDNTFAEGICQNNSYCTYGCKPGFTGADCNERSTSITTFSTPTDKDNPHSQSNAIFNVTSTPDAISSMDNQSDNSVLAAAVGGGVSGGVILTVIVTVIVCLMKRRKLHTSDKDEQGSVNCTEAVNPAYDPEMVTAQSSQQFATQPNDSIYAQPNKLKISLSNKESIGDKHARKYATIDTDMNAEKDCDEGTDSEETAELEDLDDGEANVIVTEAVATKSDTYYNTEGLKRSRTQVSKLLDYIQGKTDFRSEFERLPNSLTRPCNEALKPHNRAKNRYNGIYSYDATRVVLKSKDYINASHIEGYENPKAYIASLGPTKSTMPQFAVFWEMVWQENTQKIVMLTNLKESGKMKCDQYWPDCGSSRQYGAVCVTAKAEHTYVEFAVRELLVAKGGNTRTVTQYHYTAWPDKSVPDTVVSLLEFRNKVEKKISQKYGPMIVHCSAGIGRTGTYIALDTLIKEGKAENSVDIFGCVNALRGQRVNMVQNAEQYEFLHHCVVYALTCKPEPLDGSSLTSLMTSDKMNEQFEAFANIFPLTCKETDAILTITRKKENRKGSDIPGDRHRVKLTETKKDYINAVYVDGYLQANRYILAQTPMPNTVEDFLSLLYQENVGLVVCLDEEDGKDKTIGHYVASANKVSKFGHFHVSTESCESNEGFVVRTLKISKFGTSSAKDLKIQHYQFLCWKNAHSVPENLQTFMRLITAVNKHSGPEDGILLFHCLDGATKCGIMCAVSIMQEKFGLERELSVINTICQVRGRRQTAIKEFKQFQFCYSCVRDHLETSDTKTYYNIL